LTIVLDGSHNDSRMNVTIAMTAVLYGATVLNHTEVNGLIKDPETGKINGVKMKDLLHQKKFGRRGFGEGNSQEEFVVRTKVSVLRKCVIEVTSPTQNYTGCNQCNWAFHRCDP
jgi:hypothetical protein